MDDSVHNKDQQDVAAEAANKQEVSEQKPEANSETSSKAPDKKKHRTTGNIIYDFGVFGSAAWLGVSAMSAITANEAMNGSNKNFNWLRSLHKNVTSGLTKFFSKTILKNASPETLHGTAGNMSMIFILGMGGNTMVAPIKWLEDHRQSNAAKIDNLLGTTPPDKDVIAKEPKQSWKSVLTGRLLSWGACFASVAAVGPKLVGKVNDYFGEKGANFWMKMKPHSNPVKVRKWSDLISFDLLATALTATVTWALSRSFAKKHDRNLDDVEDSLYQLNMAAPNPLGDLDEADTPAKPGHAESVKQARKNYDPAAAAFVNKIKGDEKAHAAAASFIDKVQRDTSVQPALS